MVRTYKKKSFKGRAGRRTVYGKSRMSARKAAFTALRKVKSVERKIERKTRVTLDTGLLQINNMGGTYNMRSSCVGVQIGDGRDQRDGNKISPSSMKFHGDITWHGTGGQDQWLRVVIIQDLRTQEPNGPILFSGSTDVDLMSNNGFLSEFNLQTRSRYKVLYNKHFKFDTKKSVAEPIYFTGRIALPKEIKFNGSNTGDIAKNNVWVYAWGSSSASTLPIALRFYSRMWYTDL